MSGMLLPSFAQKTFFTTALVFLAACGQTPKTSNAEFTSLKVVEIGVTDRPEQFGSSLVGWYPELGKAIVGQTGGLTLQGAKNKDTIQVLETQQAAHALGMPVDTKGWATWGTGWATWGTGWATWGTGQGSVFGTGENQATWTQINLSAGRNFFTKLGQGVKVAVIDTGIDLQHPAFANRLVPASEMFDFVDNDSIPQEVVGHAYGHGTNIAGIVAQIAEKAQIMPLRVLDGNGTGDSDQVIAAVNWAVEKGARIINLSIGTYDSEALAVALDNATRKGIFVVTATGNSGNSDVNFPARAAGRDGKSGRWGDMAISVTSVDRFDRRSRFANYGKNDVGMSAPGEFIYAPAPDNRVAAWSGTSMATPMVSASLALAVAERKYKDIRQLGKAIRDQSRKIDKLNPDYSKAIGKGRLDLSLFAQQIQKLK
jgi:thermitase